MHVDVAGCAGAAAAALGVDAVDALGAGQFHEHVAGVAVDGDHLVVKRLEIDGWHASAQTKGRAFYLQSVAGGTAVRYACRGSSYTSWHAPTETGEEPR